MIDVLNTNVPFIPFDGRQTGTDRLGPKPIVQPDTARPLSGPEQSEGKQAFSERKAAIESSLLFRQPVPSQTNGQGEADGVVKRSAEELAARIRFMALEKGRDLYADMQELVSNDHNMQPANIVVKLALPDEEASKEFTINVKV